MSQLNDQTEQQLYNGFTASSADTLNSQLERQVYNAYTAAGGGGGGGGGTGPSPATATPLADSGQGTVGTSLKYAREDHVHPSNGGGGTTPELTEEHIVGYLNGKPVYEKLIVCTSPSATSAWTNMVAVPVGYGSTVSIDAVAFRKDGKEVSLSASFPGVTYCIVAVTGGYLQMYNSDATNMKSVKLHVTLRYTKTTD